MKQRIKTGASFAAVYNRRLDDLRARAFNAAVEPGSAEELIDVLAGGRGTFTAYVESLIEGLTEDGANWRRLKYKSRLSNLHGCLGEHFGWGH